MIDKALKENVDTAINGLNEQIDKLEEIYTGFVNDRFDADFLKQLRTGTDLGIAQIENYIKQLQAVLVKAKIKE